MSVSFDPKFIKFSKVAASPLLTGLTSYWKLNETTGNALDEKGLTTLPNNATTINQAGKLGTCYLFDGSTSYLGVEQDYSGGPKNTNYEYTTGMTISAWVKLAATGVYQTIASNYYSSTDDGWGLIISDTNHVIFSVNNSTMTPTGIDAIGTTTFSTGTWYHVVATFDGTYAKIYVNGTLEDTSDAWAHSPRYVANSSFFIGMRYNELNFNGNIDEVGMWGTDIGSTNITTLYNSGTGITYPF